MKKINKAFTAKALGALLLFMFLSLPTIRASSPTDYFQSNTASGNWGDLSTWQSSSTGNVGTWVSSTLIPTSSAAAIYIRSGNSVTINVAATARLITVDAGGVLIHLNSVPLTIIDDGSSTADFSINGRYQLNGTMPSYGSVNAKVVISSGAEVRATDNASPGASDDFARHNQVFFNTGSLFSWYTFLAFQTGGSIIYFPNASTDKTVFRINANVGLVGAGAPTTFNCKFEVAAGFSVTFQNAGAKIFRDGLGGAGTLIHSSTCGPFQITSATAVIDGSLTVDIENSSVSGDDFEIPAGANVTMSGTAKVNIGKSPNIPASMRVDGTFTSNGFLTFKSDANGTARVAQSTGTINGNVTIERFIPAKRAWRLLTHSLKVDGANTQTINQAWQEGATPNPSTLVLNNPNPGYGTQITKNRAFDVVNGYDANLQVNPSLYVMDTGIVTIPSTYTPIRTYRSYFLFVRGNRANQINLGTAAPVSSTTLRTRGSINIGTTTISASVPSGKWIGVGNPYVSTIDISGVLTRSTGIDPTTFAIWDPGLSTFGGYVTYLSGISTPLTTNYPTNASPLTIQSGQAFLLKTTSATQSVQFVEGDKVASSSSAVFARPIRIPVLQIELRDSSAVLLDGVAIGSAPYARASKLGNFGSESIRLVERDTAYAIILRPLEKSDTFYLEYTNLKKQTYHLRFTETFDDLNVQVQLIDRFTRKHIPFTKGINGYAFEVTADSASFRNRFVLVVRSTPPKQLSPRAISIAPNPVRGFAQVRVDGVSYTGVVTISDLAGRAVATRWVAHGVVDCSMIPPGAYLLVCPGQGSALFIISR